MQPNQLRLFADIAEIGSISGVAQARGQAQSHISRQLAQLERICGGPLFYRTGRGVSLSELGQQTLPKVRAWLNATDGLIDEIKSSSGQISGLVRIGIMPSAAHPLTTTLFRRVQAQYPNIKLQISELGALLENWVETGKLDIAIVFRYGEQTRKNERALATTDVYLVGPAGDAITQAKEVEFAKLADLTLALPARRTDLREQVEEIARAKNLHLNVVVEANSVNFQRAAVAEGLCHTLMGPTTVLREISSGKLQVARVIKPRIKRTMTLAVSNQGPISTACKTVIKLLEQIAEEDRDWWPPTVD